MKKILMILVGVLVIGFFTSSSLLVARQFKSIHKQLDSIKHEISNIQDAL